MNEKNDDNRMDVMCEHAKENVERIREIKEKNAGTMSNEREIRQKCGTCNRIMIWNLGNRREQCRTRESSENINKENAEITKNINVEIEEIRVSEGRIVIKQRCREIKVKSGVKKMKDEGITRLVSVNCNRLGPGSNYKIDQAIRESKRRNVDEIMISP